MPGLILPPIRSSLPPLPFDFPSRFELKREVSFTAKGALEDCRMAENIRVHPPVWRGKKWDGSRVSAADFSVQWVRTRAVAKEFPADVILSEEDGRTLGHFSRKARRAVVEAVRRHDAKIHPRRLEDWIEAGRLPPNSSRYWTQDPIDVTIDFIDSIGTHRKSLEEGRSYAVNLALIVDGEIKIGAIACPYLKLPHSPSSNRGELLLAVQGYGAWSCGLTEDDAWHRLRVSPDRLSLSESVWARPLRDKSFRFTDRDYHLVMGCHRVFEDTVAKWRRGVSPVRFAWVASGMADFFMNFRLDGIQSPFYVHDYAAGILLVQEAGGTVTTLRGLPPNFRKPPRMGETFGMLVSNSPPDFPLLREEALQVFRRVATPLLSEDKRRRLYDPD